MLINKLKDINLQATRKIIHNYGMNYEELQQKISPEDYLGLESKEKRPKQEDKDPGKTGTKPPRTLRARRLYK
jgi:hypothetical protein